MIDTTYQLVSIPGAEFCPCPCCGSAAHALPQCRAWAAQAGEPLIGRLRDEIAELEIRLAEYRSVNTMATNALYRYHALYGALPEAK